MESDEIMKLFDEQGDAIYNFCLYLSKNKHDGEDLLQQTFLKAIEISSKIDKDNNPKSYLCSIAIMEKYSSKKSKTKPDCKNNGFNKRRAGKH